MPDKSPIAVFWFRRDLRLDDNAGLYHALKSGLPVLPLFIFDTDILARLDTRDDARVSFIYDTIQVLHHQLKKHHSGLLVRHAKPVQVWKQLLEEYTIQAVYTNEDYEPYAKERDAQVAALLKKHNASFHAYKDQVIFAGQEVVKANGTPYTVFTPYSKSWLAKLHSDDFYTRSYPCSHYYSHFLRFAPEAMPTLESIGFTPSPIPIPSLHIDNDIIKHYDQTRDFPALPHSTTRLGIHLRFGTLSIRALVHKAQELNATYLKELVWREFYMMILDFHPQVVTQSFHRKFDRIQWDNDEAQFEAWCNGRTGYPLVDAGMRQMNAIGYMHNRVRMVCASFLCKHLLIDWRWGEAYFAEKLLDYELASNNGGWQWAAGTGTDAAPYFRVFNPALQAKRFDPKGKYIQQWVPEYGTPAYPAPIVVHEEARERALQRYKKALA